MKTVAQEMSSEERRTRLLHGLNATGDENVVVELSHLAHAIGMETAEGMISNLVAMDGLVTTPYSKQPKHVSAGMCEINRLEAIEAIKRVQEKTEKIKIDNLVKKK